MRKKPLPTILSSGCAVQTKKGTTKGTLSLEHKNESEYLGYAKKTINFASKKTKDKMMNVGLLPHPIGKRILVILSFLISNFGLASSQTRFDSICHVLKQAPIQEKVYLHLDNNCYFKGDTIWYKAYVVKAGDLTYTDMSRILYVELVSPDGLVVERQSVVVSPDGFSCGDFELKDSLYSGFFEIRAYTRWMLNFDVTEHPYWRKDKQMFYSSMMAKDFFRLYGTIYSRVFPVYERPEIPGDFSEKVVVNRPKTNVDRPMDEKLTVTFYPEGGNLVAGTKCRVAFEAHNEQGEQVQLTGKIDDMDIQTIHEGRGVADIDVPENGKSLRAVFDYRGKKKQFDLPDIVKAGCALRLSQPDDEVIAKIQLRGLPTDREYMAFVLCRGMLQQASLLSTDAQGKAEIKWKKKDLSTGVNDLIIMDQDGIPLADRLFFVNNHDYELGEIQVEQSALEYAPHQLVDLDFQAPADAGHISISVRDGQSDIPTYDTGDILTDLLLSSELRGFIPHPDYYFEKDDESHAMALDHLMLVQGWRRYDIKDLLSPDTLRYTPERNLTVEGRVYKPIIFDTRNYEADEAWANEFFNYSEQENEGYRDDNTDVNTSNDIISSNGGSATTNKENAVEIVKDEDLYFMDHGTLKHEVTVESELILGKNVYSVNVETHDGGRFSFNMPAFYDKGILTLSAHKTDISEKKELQLKTKGRLDEETPPEYYVKRDLFYPVFAKKYSYYQCHYPMENLLLENNDDPGLTDTLRISKMDKTLSGIVVKGKRRRGLRSIDYTRPLCTYDAVDLYNLATDYGLSYGMFSSKLFPMQISMLLLGNLNTPNSPEIDTKINYYMTYLDYTNRKSTQEVRDSIEILKIRGYDSQKGHDELRLRRLNKINVFSDFELRNDDQAMVAAQNKSIYGFADVTIDYVTMLDDAVRPTFRDRWIIIPGIYEPDEFYHPDYSASMPSPDHADYRRTLYWNPNAKLDENGQYKVRFYNNSKTTRIKVSAMGISRQGKPISNR